LSGLAWQTDIAKASLLQGVRGVQGVQGVQEFRSSGVQEFRSSGVQEFRSSGVQEFDGWNAKSQAESAFGD
jgi:hypothetical protein